AQGGGVDIVAWDDKTLKTMFYWALNGTSTWHSEEVTGAISRGTTDMTAFSGKPAGVHVVGTTYFSGLESFTNINGSGTWQASAGSTVAVAAGEASVTENGGSENIAFTDIGGNLDFLWADGSGQFHQELVDAAPE
ncbi:MAG TPA: hypothetical protein VIZ00_17515, partial [Streptosporangiaceae bacterium]